MDNLQKFSAMSLLDLFQQTIAERALLTFSDAPAEELRSVQVKADLQCEEILRRMSW
jgi:hypothetical protein